MIGKCLLFIMLYLKLIFSLFYSPPTDTTTTPTTNRNSLPPPPQPPSLVQPPKLSQNLSTYSSLSEQHNNDHLTTENSSYHRGRKRFKSWLGFAPSNN